MKRKAPPVGLKLPEEEEGPGEQRERIGCLVGMCSGKEEQGPGSREAGKQRRAGGKGSHKTSAL